MSDVPPVLNVPRKALMAAVRNLPLILRAAQIGLPTQLMEVLDRLPSVRSFEIKLDGKAILRARIV